MSHRQRYCTRSKERIDQKISELSSQLPPTRRMTSFNKEQVVSNEDLSLDTKDMNKLGASIGINVEHSNESMFSSSQQTRNFESTQIYLLQKEIDCLRKELELLKLKQSESLLQDIHSYRSDPHVDDHTRALNIPSTPAHFIISTDPLQQMKDFVRPFYGNPEDDIGKWIESITHYFDIARLPGEKEQLYLQYAPAFLKEYAYKWWTENKHAVSDWSAFKQLVTEQFGNKNDFLLERQLDQRKQQLNEPVIKYYYDIISLCKKYDPKISDKQKICKLTNGLRLSLYQEAIKETYATSSEFLSKVQHLESIQKLIELRQTQVDNATSWNKSYSQVPSYDRSNNWSTLPNYDYLSKSYDRNAQQSRRTQHPSDQQSTHSNNRAYSSSRHSNGQFDASNYQCYTCGRFGHFARNCPEGNQTPSDLRPNVRTKN